MKQEKRGNGKWKGKEYQTKKSKRKGNVRIKRKVNGKRRKRAGKGNMGVEDKCGRNEIKKQRVGGKEAKDKGKESKRRVKIEGKREKV